MNIVEALRENKEILQHLDASLDSIPKSKIFAEIAKFNNKDLAQFKLIITDILVWGGYAGSTKRKPEFVVEQINQEYVDKFMSIVSDTSLSAKELFEVFNTDINKGGLRLKGVRYAYFTKFIHFFTTAERGLVIFDRYLAENSLKLAHQLQDAEYFNSVIEVIYNKNQQYTSDKVKSDTYQSYCDFMKRAVSKLKSEYGLEFDSIADLELVLFGWGRGRKHLKAKVNLSDYTNPRNIPQQFNKIA